MNDLYNTHAHTAEATNHVIQMYFVVNGVPYWDIFSSNLINCQINTDWYHRALRMHSFPTTDQHNLTTGTSTESTDNVGIHYMHPLLCSSLTISVFDICHQLLWVITEFSLSAHCFLFFLEGYETPLFPNRRSLFPCFSCLFLFILIRGEL